MGFGISVPMVRNHHSRTISFASMTKEPPLPNHHGGTLTARGTVRAREIGGAAAHVWYHHIFHHAFFSAAKI